MRNKTRLPALIPALCALLIVLSLTVLRPAHVSDFTRGGSIGVLIGLSIISVMKLKRSAS